MRQLSYVAASMEAFTEEMRQDEKIFHLSTDAPPAVADGRWVRQFQFDHDARFQGGVSAVADASPAGVDDSFLENPLISFVTSPVSSRFLQRT